MKKWISITVLMTLSSILSSCLVPSESSLDILPDKSVDPAPYLGKWILYMIGPRTQTGTASLEVIQGATSALEVNVTDEFTKGRYEVLLTKIGEDVYGCARTPDLDFDIWSLFKPVLSKDQKQLEIRGFDQKSIASAIKGGHLKGSVTNNIGANMVSITDEGSNIRQFLEVYDHIVQSTPTITLRRPM